MVGGDGGADGGGGGGERKKAQLPMRGGDSSASLRGTV